MLFARLSSAALLLAVGLTASAWSTRQAGGDEARAAVMPAEQFVKAHTMLRPQDGESKGLDEVHWVPNLWEARQQAAAQGKMLFILETGGQPLGFC